MKLLLFPFRKAIGRNRASRRKHARKEYSGTADWDFFTGATGAKSCIVENLSPGGCLIRSPEPIQNRRWVRLILKDEQSDICRTVIGWVVRLENGIGPAGRVQPRDGFSYRYGVEFLHSASRVLALD